MQEGYILLMIARPPHPDMPQNKWGRATVVQEPKDGFGSVT